MSREPYKGPTDWLGRPVKRPYLWERNVTVCIAAECLDRDGGYRIVCCTDRLGSSVLGRSETFLKNRSLGRNWRALVAGPDTAIEALLRHYRLAFRDDYDETVETLDYAVKTPAHARKRELAEEYTQTHFALPYDEFLKIGKEKFPEDLFRDAMRNIRAVDLEAEFILVGFLNGAPETYHCDRSGKVYPISSFSVIGEGAYLATAALYRREQQDTCSLEKTLYNVYEAKKYAEAVGSVGKTTLLTVLCPDGSHRLTSAAAVNRLDELFEQYGPKSMGNPEIAGPLYYDEEKRLGFDGSAGSEATR